MPAPPDSTIQPRGEPGQVVVATDVRRRYGEGESAVEALRGVSLSVSAGQFVAIMGPSGSGKSTLMHVLAGLDRPTAGAIRLDGHDITAMSDQALTLLRRDRIGFVFQFFNLLPILSAEENVVLPLTLAGSKPDPGWIEEVLDRVGLADRRSHRPSELSGGQQQRVAIARALATRPAVLFADEPTGNLDSGTGQEILSLLRESVEAYGQTALMVTHDPVAAAAADRVLLLADGRLVRDLGRSTEAEVLAALGELTGGRGPRDGAPEVAAAPGERVESSEPAETEPAEAEREEAGRADPEREEAGRADPEPAEPEPQPEKPDPEPALEAGGNGAAREAPAALETAWRPAVLAYCTQVCGDRGAGPAADGVFTSFRDWADRERPGERAARDDALVRITRAEAAKRALVSVEAGEAAGTAQAKVRGWLGREEVTSACRAMPTMLAARANAVLSPEDVDRMTGHLTRCLVCRASEQRFADAERAFADRRRDAAADVEPRVTKAAASGAATAVAPAAAAAPSAAAPESADRGIDAPPAGDSEATRARPASGRDGRPSPAPADTAVLRPPPALGRKRRAGGGAPSRRRAAIVVAAVVVPTVLVVALIALALGGSADEPSQAPAADGSAADAEAPEDATGADAVPPPPTSVAVLSGTAVPGLAERTAKRVEGDAFEIDTVGNAKAPVLESVVLYRPGAAGPAREVARKLKVDAVEPMDRDDRKVAGDAQVLVLTGPDLAPNRVPEAPTAGTQEEGAPASTTPTAPAPEGETPPGEGGAPAESGAPAAPSATP